MASARDEILGRMRRAQTRRAEPHESSTEARLGLIPPRFVREAPDLTGLFLAKLTAASASHARLDRLSELPAHLSEWLAAEGLPTDLILAQEDLIGLDWTASGLAVSHRQLETLSPGTVLSRAFAGVAEAGSVALSTCGASRPSHNILADTHIVVLDRQRILPTIEDVWHEARRGGLPRSLAFVTGPSRTADIEMTIELGVHGAVNLHIVVLGKASPGK